MTDISANPDHIALAFRIAARWGKRLPWLADEFESACLVGLVEAARTWRPGDCDFKSHVWLRVRSQLARTIRLWRPYGYRKRGCRVRPVVESIESPIDGHDSERIADTLDSGDEPVGWEAEYQDEVDGMARMLRLRDGEVFRAVHGHANGTKSAVAEVFRLRPVSVYRILYESYAEIRGRYAS